MKIVVFGNKTSTSDFLKNIVSNGYRPECLVTLSNMQKSKVEISGVDHQLEKIALENNIEIFNPSGYGLKCEDDLAYFNDNNFDVGFCLGWQRLIPSSILASVKHGIFGWHGSGFKFPNGRGRSPINWSIRLGCEKIYHNCFKYSSDVDDGQIFDTATISIHKEDYISDMQAKALEHIKISSIDICKNISAKTLELKAQHGGAFIELPKLCEEDGFLQAQLMDVDQAINIVRSCSRPFPGSFLRFEGKKLLRIWKMNKVNYNEKLPSGTLTFESPDRLMISFTDGMAIIEEFDILENSYFSSSIKSICVD